MDLTAQYHQQQQQYLQQPQPQEASSQTYVPSQAQSYDQSTQAYYAYNQYYQYDPQNPQQQQQYAYYSQDYSTVYQQPPQIQQEHTSIHPPGVPIQSEMTQMAPVVSTESGLGLNYDQNSQNAYYYHPQAVVDPQQQHQQQQQHFVSSDQGSVAGLNPAGMADPYAGNVGAAQMAVAGQQWPGYGSVPMHSGPVLPIGAAGQSSYRGGGGGRRGGRPFRGGGRGGHFGPRPSGPVAVRQPQRMAWCELCRVDCNTYEILEQHKNGKRHQKNLKIQEDLQKHNKAVVAGKNEQIPSSSELLPERGNEQPPQENVSSEAVDESKVETEEQKVSEEQGQGRGDLKRKAKGARGGKRPRTSEGPRRLGEPHKPKETVPFVCELCHVECNSLVIFQAHLAGKKHMANLKIFQDEQAILGQVALQALTPALQALLPAIQALYQSDPNAATNPFGIQFHQQGFHGSQGYFGQPSLPMIPQGQTSAPPSDQQDPKPQDSGTENADKVGANGDEQSVKVEIEAEPDAIEDKRAENGDSETERKEDDAVAGSGIINTMQEPTE